jgi:nitroreductase
VPVPRSPAVGVELEPMRPWTLGLVRRGLRRRLGLVVGGVRDALLLPAAVRSEIASSLFYALASRAFDREHRAVIAGRRKYAEMEKRLGEHRYLLRRNIHMLEKGLVMRPRRPVFAVDYIAPTVKVYGAMLQLHADAPDLVDMRELKWAGDVLTAYFDIAGDHPTINKVRSWWTELPPLTQLGERLSPHERDLDVPPPVALEALARLAKRRRSVRWFERRPVARELIDGAIEVAMESPSACNRQPFEFRIFDEPDRVQEVASIPLGTRGFVHNIPVAVVIVGKMSAFFSDRDRHLIYIDGSLAAMSFILALEAVGLSSCLLNWPDVADEERRMSRLLALDADERVVMLIAVGYPDPSGSVPASGKKSIDRFRRYG